MAWQTSDTFEKQNNGNYAKWKVHRGQQYTTVHAHTISNWRKTGDCISVCFKCTHSTTERGAGKRLLIPYRNFLTAHRQTLLRSPSLFVSYTFFPTVILSPAELINLPFIPKSCSSVQEVTHAAPQRRVRSAWLGNECSYSQTIIYCEMFGCKAECYRIHFIPNTNLHWVVIVFATMVFVNLEWLYGGKTSTAPGNLNLCNHSLFSPSLPLNKSNMCAWLLRISAHIASCTCTHMHKHMRLLLCPLPVSEVNPLRRSVWFSVPLR